MSASSPLLSPAAADLVLAFVNTNAGGQPERLGSGQDTAAWFAEAGLGDLRVSDREAGRVRELRAAVQTMMAFHADTAATEPEALEAAESAFQRHAAKSPVVCVVTTGGAALQPGRDGVSGAIAAIVAAVTELAFTGAWQRMKTCRNAPCHEGFYDRSRNGSAQYHSTNCSSQVAMRAYRKRKAGKAMRHGTT